MTRSKQLVFALFLFCGMYAKAHAQPTLGELRVCRWQVSIGLNWGEDEVTDVANYLNAAHYGFSVNEQKGLLQKRKPRPNHPDPTV